MVVLGFVESGPGQHFPRELLEFRMGGRDGVFTARHECGDATFTTGGSAQTSASCNEFGFFNDAGQARAGFGTINIDPQHVGANPGGFPTAIAVGGCSDRGFDGLACRWFVRGNVGQGRRLARRSWVRGRKWQG
jgi:hypothetical protein